MTWDQIPAIVGLLIATGFALSMLDWKKSVKVSMEPTPEEIRSDADEALERARRLTKVTTAPAPEPDESASTGSTTKSWTNRWNAFRAWRNYRWAQLCSIGGKSYKLVQSAKGVASFTLLVVLSTLVWIYAPEYLEWENRTLARLVSLAALVLAYSFLNNLFRKAGDDIPLEDLTPEEADLEARHKGNLAKLKKLRKELNLKGKESDEDKKKKELERRRETARLEKETLEIEEELAYVREHHKPPPWSKGRRRRKKKDDEESDASDEE